MLDTVRTLLLAAVGAVDLTEAKLRQVTDDLVRRGVLAADDAKSVLVEWAEATAGRHAKLDDRVRLAVEEALGRYNVASHTSVVDLQARMTALEDAIGRLAAQRPGA